MLKKQLTIIYIILFLGFLSPSLGFANGYDAAHWVDRVLKTTLAVNYTDTPQNIKAHQHFYSRMAWGALGAFLGHYVPIIRKNNLTITPFSTSYASIVQSGYLGDKPFWEVHEEIALPQLNLKILFKVTVVDLNNVSHPYVIQKLDMVRSDY